METTITGLRHVIVPIIFALTCLLVATAFWKAFGGGLPLEANGYRVVTDVPQANAIFSNTSVRMAGVEIGRVDTVERVDGRARVTLEIDEEFAPLRRSATAIVRTKTLLGEGYIEIAPGRAGTPELPEGGRLATAPIVQQRLDDVLGTFSPKTRGEVRRLFAGLASAFKGRAKPLNRTLGNLEAATGDLSTVLNTLGGQSRQLQRLVADSGAVFASLGRRSTAMQEIITQGNRVLATTGTRDRDLKQVLREFPPFLTSLRGTSAKLEQASGDLNRAVVSLKPTVPLLKPGLAAFTRDTPAFQRLFAELTPTLRTARTGLPATTSIVKTAGPSIPNIYRASRELIPFMQLAAVDADSVVGSLTSVGTLANGTIDTDLGPVEYGSIVLTVWNEIVGGWVKRLPSNRANPYAKPNAQDEIAKGGLTSYDCRNIHNPPLLQIGENVPCREQGPWTFNGKSAYYPRLELAPK